MSKVPAKKGAKQLDATKDKKLRKGGKSAREKGEKGAGGGPRTGAKANKEALEEIRRKLEFCIMRDEFDKS